MTAATIEAKKNILNLASGDALEAVGYITKEEVALVGAIQADLLAIRDACKTDGQYDEAKLVLLPTGDRGPDLNRLITDEATRKKLIADLGITPEKIAAALAVTTARGSIQQDKEIFVPLATGIQEKTGLISPAVKAASIGAQQFERLAREFTRVRDQGADPEAAAKAFDLKTFDSDSAISKEIQAIRRQINELEKNTPKGQKIDPAALVIPGKALDAIDAIQKLYDQAISGEVNAAKITALETYKLYSLETAINNFEPAKAAAPKADNAAPAPTDASAPPAESTTIGATLTAIKVAVVNAFKDIAGIVTNIAHLDKTGDAQLEAINQKAAAANTDMKSFLSRIFTQSAGTPAEKIELNIGNSKLDINAKGSFTKSGGTSGQFTPVEAYAFAKSVFANPALVQNGLHLQILNDGGVTAKDPAKYTETDLKNLALCYVAAKKSGLNVLNETDLINTTFNGKQNLITEAMTSWDAFAALSESPENPQFKEAKAQLDQMTVETVQAAAPEAAPAAEQAPVEGSGGQATNTEDRAEVEAGSPEVDVPVATPAAGPQEHRIDADNHIITVRIETRPAPPAPEA